MTDKEIPLPSSSGKLSLDNRSRSERSLCRSIVVGRTEVRAIEGDAGAAAARAQGEVLLAIALKLGLLDEEGG